MSRSNPDAAVVRALESFRDLEITLEQLRTRTGNRLHFEKSVRLGVTETHAAWTGVERVTVDVQHLAHALDLTLESSVEFARLAEWANVIILLDDCFEFADRDTTPQRDVIPDVLHVLAFEGKPEIGEAGLRYLKSCLLQGETPDLALL